MSYMGIVVSMSSLAGCALLADVAYIRLAVQFQAIHLLVFVAIFPADPLVATTAALAAVRFVTQVSDGARTGQSTVVGQSNSSRYEITVGPDFPGDGRRMPIYIRCYFLERMSSHEHPLDNKAVRL